MTGFKRNRKRSKALAKQLQSSSDSQQTPLSSSLEPIPPPPSEQPKLATQQYQLLKNEEENNLRPLEQVEEVQEDQNLDQQLPQKASVAILLQSLNSEKSEQSEKDENDNRGEKSEDNQNSQINPNRRQIAQEKELLELSQDLPASRKCFNKQCGSKKVYKKIRSMVEAHKYRFFCQSCYYHYYNKHYCEFCQQIYANGLEDEDDDKWIGCDHCERWNHTECQKMKRHKNIMEMKDKQQAYSCLVCQNLNKTPRKRQRLKKKPEVKPQPKITVKQKASISLDQRISIFHIKPMDLPSIQKIAQDIGHQLYPTSHQIQQELKTMRILYVKDNPKDIQKSVKKPKKL